MGNINTSNKRFLDDWVQLEKQGSPGTHTNVWVQKRGNNKIEMIEYPLHVSSEDDIEEQREIFWLRLNHHQLVSSLYFLDETQNEFCSSNYQGNIFIERIPLTLQTVTDIPFPDALHIYQQSLIGFHILGSQIVKTCFPISQQHIGINCEAVCKVWMNPRYEKNFPSRNERIQEHAMVRMILETIQENVDLGSIQGIPSPMSYIYGKSLSPSEVRFDEAIKLFNEYTKEYFGGQVPSKLECVDRVGGVFNLSKNWKNRYDSMEKAVRNHDPQLMMTSSRPQSQFSQQQRQVNLNTISNNNLYNNNVSPAPINNVIQFGENNNYTSFRRQEPMMQTVGHQGFQIRGQSTPSFSRTADANFFNGGNNLQSQQIVVNQPQQIIQQQPQVLVQQQIPVQVQTQPQFQPLPQIQPQVIPKIQQQNRPIQQVVYENNATFQSPRLQAPQIMRTLSQKQIIGSIVRVPSQNNGVVLNSQRSQVRESFIQNKVVNNQISFNKKSIIVQQQFPIQQQLPVQQRQIIPKIPLNFLVNVVPQQQVPVNIAQQGSRVIFNQQSQVRPIQSVINQQNVPIVRQSNIVRKSNVTFGSQMIPQQQTVAQQQVIPQQQQVISQPQIVQQPQFIQQQQPQFQVAKTTSLYATPQGITKVQTQRTEIRNQFIERQQINKVQVTNDQLLNLRLRNNEQSISSINPQTNQVPSNEQISDKFSVMKQEPMDASTRNFYQNIMNGTDNTQKQQGNDYFSSYYANYTSKLYDSNEANENESGLNQFVSKKVERQPAQFGGNKYNVTLDDGMSSADFLSQLKNLKPSSTTNPFLKTETNYDYGVTNKYKSDYNTQETYKFDYKSSTTKLTSDINPQNDLNVNVEKLNIVPASNYVSSSERDQYNINYEHQSGKNNAGNLNYESQTIQVSRNDGSYAEEYYETANYQSTFDKYANLGKYQSQTPLNLRQNEIQLGGDLQTQYSRARNSNEEGQYMQATKNTVTNNSYYDYSPMQQRTEEQYQVDYDPEILADLEKLKGAY